MHPHAEVMMRSDSHLSTTTTPARMDIPRAAVVTLGLGITGAALGAPFGAALLTAIMLITEYSSCFPCMAGVPTAGGIIGAGLGFFAFPFTAWSLPRVSMGRILIATAVGMTIGSAAGLLMPNLDGLGSMIGAMIGFGTATSWLGYRSGLQSQVE